MADLDALFKDLIGVLGAADLDVDVLGSGDLTGIRVILVLLGVAEGSTGEAAAAAGAAAPGGRITVKSDSAPGLRPCFLVQCALMLWKRIWYSLLSPSTCNTC